MHSIKSRARHASWKSDEETKWDHLNPFMRKRIKRRETAVDEEEARFSAPQNAYPPTSPTSTTNDAPVEGPAKEYYNGADNSQSTTLNGDAGDGISRSRKTATGLRPVEEEGQGPEEGHSDSDVDYKELKKRKLHEMMKRKIPLMQQIKSIFFGSWINVLFLFVPSGFAVNYTHRNAVTVFCVNFMAIIPSASVLAFAVDEVQGRSEKYGNAIGALLNMTFNNAVQLITSIFLLRSRQIEILQISLLGTILSNLLLMTGVAFFFGGINRLEQYFNASLAQTVSMLLLLAVTSLVIPTASHLMTNTTKKGIVAQSRGTSVVILISYGLWLFFQLKTNREMFEENDSNPISGPSRAKTTSMMLAGAEDIRSKQTRRKTRLERGDSFRALAKVGTIAASTSGSTPITTKGFYAEPEGDDWEPELSLISAILTLLVSTALIGFNTKFATDSIEGLLTSSGLSKSFVGLIILPILSDDPLVIILAIKDKMNLCIAYTLERCMQTALMIVPMIVIIAWCMKIDEMTLEFDGFSITALFASVIIVTYVVQEGKSNWLTGALLVKVFIIIALAAFYVP